MINLKSIKIEVTNRSQAKAFVANMIERGFLKKDFEGRLVIAEMPEPIKRSRPTNEELVINLRSEGKRRIRKELAKRIPEDADPDPETVLKTIKFLQ